MFNIAPTKKTYSLKTSMDHELKAEITAATRRGRIKSLAGWTGIAAFMVGTICLIGSMPFLGGFGPFLGMACGMAGVGVTIGVLIPHHHEKLKDYYRESHDINNELARRAHQKAVDDAAIDAARQKAIQAAKIAMAKAANDREEALSKKPDAAQRPAAGFSVVSAKPIVKMKPVRFRTPTPKARSGLGR